MNSCYNSAVLLTLKYAKIQHVLRQLWHKLTCNVPTRKQKLYICVLCGPCDLL